MSRIQRAVLLISLLLPIGLLAAYAVRSQIMVSASGQPMGDSRCSRCGAEVRSHQISRGDLGQCYCPKCTGEIAAEQSRRYMEQNKLSP